ncbi:MAG TPA: hypothetical protein VEZ14_03315 [Dehalococcoidia bacterium]|nr:hypothetical protein [Dehalococcoidia bacterium]
MAWRIPFIHRKPSKQHDADVREASRDVHVRLDALREEAHRVKDRTDSGRSGRTD